MNTDINMVNTNKIELHLQSTIRELNLFEALVDIDENLTRVRNILDTDITKPGVIIKEGNEIVGFLTRKLFFESLSKPYGLELFIKRPLRFLLETVEIKSSIVLPSSMLIVDAVKKFLKASTDLFNESIIVEFDNGNLKILDSYQLIIAHAKINEIAMAKLKEANELKTEILSIAAHDLKNPLNSIISLSKMMKEDTNAPVEAYLETFNQIEDISKHMVDLILELLNSTVIESGKMQLRKQIFDMDEVISAIIYQSKTQVNRKNQTLHYKINRDNIYAVEGDSLKLRESLENLISNAIKYSPINAQIEIILSKFADRIRFEVTDQGPGLTDEDKEKLFGKFQRLSAQPTNGESSTGLGLFIAKQIVELHGGEIGVDSEFGNGSTFYIELEAAEI